MSLNEFKDSTSMTVNVGRNYSCSLYQTVHTNKNREMKLARRLSGRWSLVANVAHLQHQ